MGADTDDMTNPYEVGLGKYVHLDRDDAFVGKAVLAEIKAAGVKRTFVGYQIGGEAFKTTNQHRWQVMADGVDVGFVSAAAWSPRIGSNIGVGLIATEHGVAGSVVTVDTGEAVLEAQICDLPFEIPG